jgi:hypothetical protein
LTVKDSKISQNVAVACSDTGSASVLGGAVFNNTQLTMDHVVISRNTARARRPRRHRRHRRHRPGRCHLERRPTRLE